MLTYTVTCPMLFRSEQHAEYETDSKTTKGAKHLSQNHGTKYKYYRILQKVKNIENQSTCTVRIKQIGIQTHPQLATH